MFCPAQPDPTHEHSWAKWGLFPQNCYLFLYSLKFVLFKCRSLSFYSETRSTHSWASLSNCLTPICPSLALHLKKPSCLHKKVVPCPYAGCTWTWAWLLWNQRYPCWLHAWSISINYSILNQSIKKEKASWIKGSDHVAAEQLGCCSLGLHYSNLALNVCTKCGRPKQETNRWPVK